VTYRNQVFRRLRFALTPGWILLHLVTVALLVTMVQLGRWQLAVSESKHFNVQNFGYAVQWWAFSVFVAAMWVRFLLDARRRPRGQASAESAASQPAEPPASSDPPVAYRRYVMPQSADAPAPAGDAEQAAYNDYLAKLAEDAASRSGGEGTAR
jgi:DNA-binding transcriptional regulator of glucitol operon